MSEMNIDQSINAFGEWYDLGLIVRVKEFVMLTALRRILKELSDMKIEIKYVGGFVVILVFECHEEKKVFSDDKQLWMEVFDRVEDWSGQNVDFERIAWLKVHGIPLNILCKKVYDDIASKFGTVIQSSQFAEEDNDLLVVCVGILTKYVDRIQQKIKISWRGNSRVVLIEEEVGEWVPDCLVDYKECHNISVTSVMEEECNDEVVSEGKDLNSAEPAVEDNIQVDAENSNIHDVFSQHLNEGTDGMKKKE
ncbi:hypothetical protein Hdeb2414_s0015g00452891 [Helianthus debilis subsp. tardiflorus]